MGNSSEMEERLLRQDVEELTEMLRTAPVLESLRQALRSYSFDPGNLLLAGFLEDEEENEYGAFVTPSGEVFEYERRTAFEAPCGFTSIIRVHDVQRLVTQRYPAVRVALTLCRRASDGRSGLSP